MKIFLMWMLSLFFLEGNGKKLELVDGVAAIVNDEIITIYDIDQRMRHKGIIPENLSTEKLKEKRRKFLQELINEILILDAAKKMDIDVSDEQVDAQIEMIKEKNNLTDQQFLQSIKKMGFSSLEEYKELVKREIIKANVISIKVRSRLKITEKEVNEILDKDFFGGKYEYEVRAAHIMKRVPPFAPEEAHEKAKKFLKELLKKIKSGKISFEEAAKKYSDDVTRDSGGDLGYFKMGTLEETFEAHVFKMKKGEISDIIKTPFGYHIVLLLDKRKVKISKQRQKTLKTIIRESLYQKKFFESMRNFLNDLRSKAEIKILLK